MEDCVNRFIAGREGCQEPFSFPDSRSRMTIRVGVLGDEVRSRKIYDKIGQHLPRSQAP